MSFIVYKITLFCESGQTFCEKTRFFFAKSKIPQNRFFIDDIEKSKILIYLCAESIQY